MKLTLYHFSEGRIKAIGSAMAGEVDNPLFKELPSVWSPTGERLLPADGVTYLLAVHGLLNAGSDRWTELSYPPTASGPGSVIF